MRNISRLVNMFYLYLLSLCLTLALFGNSLHATAATGTPPAAPVRNAAEFEPCEAVMIRYPFGIPYDLIKEMSLDTEVLTIVLDGAEETTVTNEYLREGVNLANCTFLHAPSDSIWTRDYGPWFFFDGNRQIGIADNGYPWPQPLDDLIPQVYGLDQGLPVFDTGLFHEGGNYMTDGQGFGFSTDLVWDDNPGLSHETIDDIMWDYLGIHTFHVVPDALTSWLEHLDCYAKYLSPDTILVGEVPTGHPNYNGLEEAVDHFESQISCYGTPYKVVRIYAPNGEPYTNSLILNRKVLVPITGSAWDDDAIASYEAAMPGYEVTGYHGSWYWFDALHCRTKGLTDRHMLYIHHIPLLDRPAGTTGFPVEAEIIAHSGQAFTSGTPEVRWSTGSGWNTTAMTHTGGDLYLAHIPAQPEGAMVQYYIHVEDASGRSEDHPYIGEPDVHTFTVNTLGIDKNGLSVDTGGVIQFNLNAGAAKAGRNYYILGSVSGNTPGLPLPGGKVLPLNWDAFTDLGIVMANGPSMVDFHGQLDSSGMASAQLDTLGPLPRNAVGVTLYFACLVDWPFDFVSNAVSIIILE